MQSAKAKSEKKKLPKGPKVRLFQRRELGVHWPKRARLMIQDLTKECADANRCFTSFSVPMAPLSLNHQYGHKPAFRKTRKGKLMMTTTKYLRDEVHVFRDTVKRAMQASGTKWSASGATAAVVIFESPTWLTQDLRIRKADTDNMLKPTHDAVGKATEVDDSRHWECYYFKVASKRLRTIVYLFDLGDVIEFFG